MSIAAAEQYLDDFVLYLQNGGYTPRTQDEYVKEAKSFMLNVRSSEIERISKADIMRYQKVLRDRGAGSATINRMLSAINCFFKALVEFEIITLNPALSIKKAKVEKNKLPVYLEEHELADFLEQVTGKHQLRNLAICLLMCYGGLRVAEVQSLNLEHFRRGADPALIFMGKGQKWRVVPLHPDIADILQQYMAEVRIEPTEGDTAAFFVSQEGRRIGRRTIQGIVDRTGTAWKKEAQIISDKKISSHKLRHTFATTHFRNGTDLRTLQELLGHSDISTTQIYTHVDNRQLSEAQAKIRPQIPLISHG